ncbi:MAG: DUF4292 domain-containing protein [Bacteroidales bacterium]|nr:DUF4292 domain-containing protein [Bacteroidales bacterium]
MTKLIKIFCIIIIGLHILSCHTSKNAVKSKKKEVTAADTAKAKPIEDPTVFLFNKLQNNLFKYKWINAKFNASATIDKKEISFNGNVKIRCDSIIWFSLSPAMGIEIARILISNDSVKLINRLESKYFTGDFKYLNQLFNTDLDFDMLQSFLTGNDFRYYENDKFKSSIYKDNYLLWTVGRRKLKKSKTDTDPARLFIEDIWLDPETYKIIKHFVNEFKQGRKLEVEYSDFRDVGGQLFPFKINFNINAEKKINVKVNFTKFVVDEPQTFPFNIPNSFNKIIK